MNNSNSEPIDDPNDDLRPEYHFDYSEAKPNRFAVQTSTRARFDRGTVGRRV